MKEDPELNYHKLADDFLQTGIMKELCSDWREEAFFVKGIVHFAEWLNEKKFDET